MCVVIAIGIPYGSMVIQGTRLGLSSCTPAAFFLLFVLLATIHIPLGLLKRNWAFQRGELITIFIMMMVATAIPTRGVVGMLLPMITGTFYYATPENEWAELIHPILSDWLVVYDASAIKGFYEGTSGPLRIPWNIWAGPLLRWLAFYASLYLILICATVILRRQWSEHERLVYPLVQVPMAMLQDDAKEHLVKPFFQKQHHVVRFCHPLRDQQRQCPAPLLLLYLADRSPGQPSALSQQCHPESQAQPPDVRLCLLHQYQYFL